MRKLIWFSTEAIEGKETKVTGTINMGTFSIHMTNQTHGSEVTNAFLS